MSSQMKFIDKIEPIVKARKYYNDISKECKTFSMSLQKLQVVLNDLADLSIPDVPTIPNTSLDDSINEHLNSLLQFSQSIKSFAFSLKEDYQNFDAIFQSRQNQRENIDNEIRSLNNIIANLTDKSVEGNVIEHRDQLCKKVANLKKLSKNKNTSKEDLLNAYNNYYQDLILFKSKTVKLKKMISKMQSLIQNYNKTIRILECSCRAQLVSVGLNSISIHQKNLSDIIDRSVSALQPMQLDFNNDFKLYIDSHNIDFHEIQYFPFDQHTLKKKDFVIETSNNVNVFPYRTYYLPEYIAQLKSEFIGENSNELTVRKGQKVGVLREKDSFEGWTLCKNLSYQTIGYIPTDFLQKVGQGIVVVKNDLGINGFDGFAGKILSYIEKDGEEKILCEDYCGNRAPVQISDIIILC